MAENQQQEIKSFAFMDIETTGLPQFNFGKVNITEISIRACLRRDILVTDENNDKIPRNIHKLTLCFNPLRMIDANASKISGLYNDMLESENPFNNNAGNLILNFLQHLQQPVCLVAHNGQRFDFPILKKSFEKIEVKIPECILCLDSYTAIKRIDEIQSAKKMLEDLNNDANGIENKNIAEKDCDRKENKDEYEENIKSEENENTKNEEHEKVNDEQITQNLIIEKYLEENNKLFEEIPLELIEKEEKKKDWQKINETTPKRKITVKINKNLKELNQNNYNNSDNNEITPTTTLLEKASTTKQDYKSRKKLFSSSLTTASDKSPIKNANSKKLSSTNLKSRPNYKLSTIYERLYGKKPDVMHHAEDDVITLQKVAAFYGEVFVQYADENAIKFSDVKSGGFR